MKTRRRNRARDGFTLVATLLLGLITMIVLGGLLDLLITEYHVVHRTYSYDNAIYLAEAGIEEGCAMLNYGGSAWAANGWSDLGGGTNYTKTTTGFAAIGSGSPIGSYVVNMYAVSSINPMIVCTGKVDVAYASMAGSNNTNVTRVVKVILGNRSTFQWGVLSQGTVNLSGNALVDSFDSSDPSYSNFDITKGFGSYSSSKNKDNGDVASNGGIINTVDLTGNAGILGHVYTGPGPNGGTNIVEVGANGFVGSLASHPAGKVDWSRVGHSINIDLPMPTSPFTTGSSLGNVNLSANSSQTISGGAGATPVDFTATGLQVSGNAVLTFTGNSRLYLNGNFSTSGNAWIVLAPGATLVVYVTGSFSVSGNGVNNSDLHAQQFQVYNLGTQATSISGNGVFAGVVYAPGSDVSYSGNGTVIGSIVGKTFSFSGNAFFHYDEALKKVGPGRGYSIVAWQEL